MYPKQKILSILKKNEHAVLSTISESGFPESALIGFGQTESLEIIFGTSNRARKYKNIAMNSKVSLVIGWESDAITIQYEGEAFEIDDKDASYIEEYLLKVPSAAIFKKNTDQRYFNVRPRWVRYCDYGQQPPLIEEHTF